jgi:hypothetical protein
MNEGKRNQEVAIDPATAIMIGKIIIRVIRMIKRCKGSDEQREDVIRNPSLLDNSTLKSIVRKELGWFKYFLFGAKIISSIKGVGLEMPSSELVACGLHEKPSDQADGNNYVEL